VPTKICVVLDSILVYNIEKVVSMSLNKEQMENIRKEFGEHAQDSGSMPVQIAALTQQIEILSDHLQRNKKDFSCKRSLLKMIARRRSFLSYLKRVAGHKYESVIKRLGLKK
jgi:small subunit ribosomal protein S15